MFGRLRLIVFVLIAAVAGAVAGRIAAEARRRAEAGEDPAGIDIRSITLRAQDLVPGLVAAVRVRDKPWSWLHIPSWLAAFGVNFGVAAVGGDLSRLRTMAERAAFGMAGIEVPGDDEPEAYEPPPAQRWGAPPPPSETGAGFTTPD
jgi:hypothetical protein